ncbi:MAG TPA: hypothetical protein VFG19_01145 [Geobacteraceae bacterium]|nr:hypothetical protein [Geobacteraceae bacterium]
MKAMKSVGKELFDELYMNSSQKEMLELTMLGDEELYRKIGTAAKDMLDSLKPAHEYLESGNIGDTTGKSASFFSNPKITPMHPVVNFDLPADDIEAGKLVYDQLQGYLDKVICGTISGSPLQGYKQENIRLATHCVEAINKAYPTVDSRIVKAFVAYHAKNQFDKCSLI